MVTASRSALRAGLAGLCVALPIILFACAGRPGDDITLPDPQTPPGGNEVARSDRESPPLADPIRTDSLSTTHAQVEQSATVPEGSQTPDRIIGNRTPTDAFQTSDAFIGEAGIPAAPEADGTLNFEDMAARGSATQSQVSHRVEGALGEILTIPTGAAPPRELAERRQIEQLRRQREERAMVQRAPSPAGLDLRSLAVTPPSTGGVAPVNGQEHDAMFFAHTGVNPFVDADIDPLLTFGLDVDTASYAIARRFLAEGTMPPESAVRVEDFVNRFAWPMAAPEHDEFAIRVDGAPSRFGEGSHHLLRIGIRGREISEAERPNAILTFVVDTSGSMRRENRIELVKRSLRMLVEELRATDEIALVEYGSQARVILPHHPIGEADDILKAIDMLQTGGSTNAEAGLRLAYDLAADRFDAGRINRVILCTDGVANVGRTGADEILEKIRADADRGITLTALGFGMDNYNDVLMERLSNEGDGIYAYIDDIGEARRVLADNVSGALMTIAREARAQVEFDPQVVRSYRLLGYENRDIADDRFRDDTVDAGEINAGHRVTVLVEVRLWDEVEEGTLGLVHLRYGLPSSDEFREIAHPIHVEDLAPTFESAAPDFRLAACAAETAEVLRGSHWARERDLNEVLAEARDAIADRRTEDTEMLEFLTLLAQARDLQAREVAPGTGG